MLLGPKGCREGRANGRVRKGIRQWPNVREGCDRGGFEVNVWEGREGLNQVGNFFGSFTAVLDNFILVGNV